MKPLLFLHLCLGMLATSGCYYDPTLAGVAPSVSVGAYIAEPYWFYYPYRDAWFFDRPYRYWHHGHGERHGGHHGGHPGHRGHHRP